MAITYCTREDVKDILEIKTPNRMDRVVDQAVESATRSVEDLTRRIFYPRVATKYFDFPNQGKSAAYRQWFETPDELISVTSVVSGGETLTSSDYFLEPVNYGPPYNRMEINLATSSDFNAEETWQRQNVIAGTWGYTLDWRAATTLSALVNSSATSISVVNSAEVGVGDLIRIGTEWLNVTNKVFIDTTDDVTLGAQANNVLLTGLTSLLQPGEVILVEAERMLVLDSTATTASVQRGYEGTVLAAHTTASVYVSRSLTVVRGVNGSTAASHAATDAVERFYFPAPVRQLAIAEALNIIKQGQTGYARTIGSGDNTRESSGKGLAELRKSIFNAYARRTRMRAV